MLTHRIALAAIVLTVAACATESIPEQEAERAEARAAEVFANDPRRGEIVNKVCFTRQIDGFGETTDRAIVIREGRDRYLVETFGGCFDLDWAQTIAFDSFSSCLTRGDRVFASESAFGIERRDLRDSCRVKAIYEWDRDAVEEENSDADASGEEQSEQDEAEALETAMRE